jgi:hypothetical protein
MNLLTIIKNMTQILHKIEWVKVNSFSVVVTVPHASWILTHILEKTSKGQLY